MPRAIYLILAGRARFHKALGRSVVTIDILEAVAYLYGTRPVFARLKLLVVEDFLPFRRVLSSLLSGTGVDIIGETSDGREAVRLAQELKPDLILLDIALPGLDGINAGRQIRELCPYSKIVFVSQESSTDVVQEAFALGASGYVHKSHAHSDLPAAIEAVLNRDKFVSPGLAFEDATV